MQLGKQQQDAGPDTGEFDAFGSAHGTPEGPWGAPAPAPVVAGTPKARSGLVLLVAFLVEAVIVAIIGNQYVADKIANTRPDSLMMTGVRNVALVYSWRVSPRGGQDVGHIWLAQTIALPSAVVVSLLLILAVIRGPITFGRAFFGAWMAVAVSAMLGGYVRGLLIDRGLAGTGVGGRPSRAEQALFGTFAPTSTVFLAGVALGLIVALFVASVARGSRRTPMVAVPAPVAAEPVPSPEPDAPPPYYPEQRGVAAVAPGSPWQDQRHGPPAGADAGSTAALPSLDKRAGDSESGTTSQLPAVDDADPASRTSAFARSAEAEPAAQEALQHDPDAVRHDPDAVRHDPDAVRHDPEPAAGEPEPTQAMTPAQQPGAEPATEPTTPEPAAAITATGPAAAGPAASEAAATEPAASEPAATASPAATEAAATEPAASEPAASEPAATEPAATEPAATGPAAAQPAARSTEHTAHLPRQSTADHQTTQFPRPPDDEDLDPEPPDHPERTIRR